MDTTSQWEQLAVEGRLMMDAAHRAGWDAPVPGLQWDVRTVFTHTGAVHRWSADIIRRALATNETGGSAAFWPQGLADDDLPGWFDEGLAALVTTLRSAPADLSCYVMLDDVSPQRFWGRRQLHETTVHRVDVEAAAGSITPIGVDHAQDGLAELVGGFATEPGFASSRPGRILLAASDGPSWTVVFGGERNLVTVGSDGAPADATVRGTSEQLYRWAWNRPVPEVHEEGDPDVLDCWRAVQVL